MKSEINNELSKLLGLDELYALYDMIGDVINTDIDLQNSGFDWYIQNNALTLLEKCDFIQQDDDIFTKKKQSNDMDDFSTNLLKKLQIVYSNPIAEIISLDKKYDENRNLFYIFKNKVPTYNSGLLMLLDDLSFIQIISNKIYILNQSEIHKFLPNTNLNENNFKKAISVVELEQNLIIKKEYGETAERKVLEYETSLLQKCGIIHKPKIISAIDVSAGYDIVSYLNKDSISFDKFIEVKSCQDETQHFYLSKNELKTAKEKGDNYYIYLYIRNSNKIAIIKNPYKQIYLSRKWIKEPQIYKICKSATSV